jgi:hypothetical protein
LAVRSIGPSAVVIGVANQEAIVGVFTDTWYIIWRRCFIDVVSIYTSQKWLIRSAIWLHEVLPLPLTTIVPAVANKVSKPTDSYLVKPHIAVFFIVGLDVSERVVIILNNRETIESNAFIMAGQRSLIFYSLYRDWVSASA